MSSMSEDEWRGGQIQSTHRPGEGEDVLCGPSDQTHEVQGRIENVAAGLSDGLADGRVDLLGEILRA